MLTHFKKLLPLLFSVVYFLSYGKKEEQTIPVVSIYYNLPKVQLKIHMQVYRKVTFPGVYANYASTYLSLQDVPQEQKEEWGIIDLDFSPFYTQDHTHTYQAPPEISSSLLLSEIQTLLGYNISGEATTPLIEKGEQPVIKSAIPPKVYPPTPKTNFITMQEILDDTSYTRPRYREVHIESTESEKIKELANHIINIQDKKLNVAQEGTWRNTSALEAYLKRLTEEEEKYLKLFIGSQVTDTFTYSFLIDIDTSDLSNYTVARFSTQYGILDSRDMKGKPILFNLENQNTTAHIKQQIKKEEKEEQTFFNDPKNKKFEPMKDGLFYRIPSFAKLSVTYEHLNLLQAQLLVPQFGIVHKLTLDMLLKETTTASFNPYTGGLVYIHHTPPNTEETTNKDS